MFRQSIIKKLCFKSIHIEADSLKLKQVYSTILSRGPYIIRYSLSSAQTAHCERTRFSHNVVRESMILGGNTHAASKVSNMSREDLARMIADISVVSFSIAGKQTNF